MTIRQHKERVVRLMEGGVKSSETRLDDLYIYSVLNSGRAWVLRQDYIKNKRWSPQAIQSYYPVYQDYFQDSFCYTRFELPTSVIQANSNEDGLVYFGGSTTNIYETNSFLRINNRNELNDFLNNPRYIRVIRENTGVMLEGLIATVISQNPFRNPLLSAVFDNPAALEDYSIEKDEYPISSDLEDMMYQHILQTTMGVVYSKRPDSPYDSQEPVKANPPTPVK